MNEKIIKAVIAYLHGNRGYKNDISGINGLEIFKILGVSLHYEDKDEEMSYILNEFLYPNVREFNDFFINFIFTKSIKNLKILNEDYFKNYFEKLILFCNDKSIPVVRFSVCLNNIKNEKCKISYFVNDPYDPFKGFIMFKDIHNPNLDKLDLKIENELINSLAHEIGHAIDVPVDFEKINNEDLKYKYHREEIAWNNVQKILASLEIYNTLLDDQAKVCLKHYWEKYFGNEKI